MHIHHGNSGGGAHPHQAFLVSRAIMVSQKRDSFVPAKIDLPGKGVRPENRREEDGGSNNVHDDSAISSSVVFHVEDDLYRELDSIDPHTHEGGEVVTDPAKKLTASQNSNSTSVSRSVTSSLLMKSLKSTSSEANIDYDSLVASTKVDGTLESIISSIHSRVGSGGNVDNTITGSKREGSIVGGKQMNDLPFREQRELLAPERSFGSLVCEDVDVGGEGETLMYSPTAVVADRDSNVIVSSVDWSSLAKSCKHAQSSFKDRDCANLVVKNMFVTHLSALTTRLAAYARRNYGGASPQKQSGDGAIETKRALKFALSCFRPPPVAANNSDAEHGMDDVEGYRLARLYRQELQDTAVRGVSQIRSADDASARRYRLHLPLIAIIYGYEEQDPSSPSSLKDGKHYVRKLAARLLCNLVTDNPSAASIVLEDVPLSPPEDQIEQRLVASIVSDASIDIKICWSDLIMASSKVTSGEGSHDREILAAVVAALHNLLTSLEQKESLIHLDSEMKRREDAKERRANARHDSLFSTSSGGCEDKRQELSARHIGFEVASDKILMNGLVRSMLPTRGVLAQAEELKSSRPKFIPAAACVDDLTDSATEWLSLVLERLASRGLLLHMLNSVGCSTSVTPEQVTLVACIRQVVEDYHSPTLTSSEERGGFGSRRLSIPAKTVGTMASPRPHPLWGRSDNIINGGNTKGRGSRSAVPIMLSLANEAEKFRTRVNELRSRPDNESNEVYNGELNCTIRIVQDILDILAQSLGRHSDTADGFLADVRLVLGRETFIISNSCQELARILDQNSNRTGRELQLDAQDQQTAIVNVRLICNLVYQCRHNQDLLRIAPVPIQNRMNEPSLESRDDQTQRTGLHVLLSMTSLSLACFTLREWTIVAIRNAVEGNDASAELIHKLKANENKALDTPELRNLGIQVGLEPNGKVRVSKRNE